MNLNLLIVKARLALNSNLIALFVIEAEIFQKKKERRGSYFRTKHLLFKKLSQLILFLYISVTV